MSYQPIYDCSVDISLDGITHSDVIASAIDRKLMIVGYKEDGGAGHPEFVFRGTKNQIVKWLREFYNADGPPVAEDDELWTEAVDQDSIKQVA